MEEQADVDGWARDPTTGEPVLPDHLAEQYKTNLMITMALALIQLLGGGKFAKKELAADLNDLVQPLIGWHTRRMEAEDKEPT